MEDYVRASAGLFGIVYFKRRASVTTPFYRFRAVFIALCYYFYLVAYHERAVETKAEVADYGVGVVLVFVEEVVYAGECNLVDVFVDFLFGHAYAVVAYCQSLVLFVKRYAHGQVAKLSLELAFLCQCLHLLRCVNGVAYHFTQENLVV